MAKEKRIVNERTIGLLLIGDENWIGGVYYILNIIRAFNIHPQKHILPELTILYNKNIDPCIITEIEGYGHVTVPIHKINKVRRAIYILGRIIFRKNFLYTHVIKKHHIEVLYPFIDFSDLYQKLPCKCVYWIYDFQHKFLPELFSKVEIEKRNFVMDQIASKGKHIVVSSFDSESHFKTFYPNSKAQLSVLQFVTVFAPLLYSNSTAITEKYKLEIPFFIVSNQFWQHKNHFVVFEAIKILKENGIDVLVVFTGKENDFRNPDYFEKIKQFISDNNIETNCKMLGFISREDQLSLMKAAMAIIQPSKFEGWGTVIEDAKCLGKLVLASDINIHREQLEKNGYFFHPEKANQLAMLMEEVLKNPPVNINYFYENRIALFVKKFSETLIDNKLI